MCMLMKVMRFVEEKASSDQCKCWCWTVVFFDKCWIPEPVDEPDISTHLVLNLVCSWSLNGGVVVINSSCWIVLVWLEILGKGLGVRVSSRTAWNVGESTGNWPTGRRSWRSWRPTNDFGAALIYCIKNWITTGDPIFDRYFSASILLHIAVAGIRVRVASMVSWCASAFQHFSALTAFQRFTEVTC